MPIARVSEASARAVGRSEAGAARERGRGRACPGGRGRARDDIRLHERERRGGIAARGGVAGVVSAAAEDQPKCPAARAGLEMACVQGALGAQHLLAQDEGAREHAPAEGWRDEKAVCAQR